MNIKDTKLWVFLRSVKNLALKKIKYLSAKYMANDKYENYLIQRYSLFMNKNAYTRGKTLSFDNPITFSEKCQWLKLYDQDPRKTIYTDKYEVRKHIKEILGEEYLIPLISIEGKDCFDNVKEIDFSKLPNSFVIKCTHGSHMNIVVKDKKALSKKEINNYKKQLKKWLRTNYAYVVSLELQYKDIKPRIIIEQYVDFGVTPRDYKFLCFNGKCYYFWISENVQQHGKITTTTTFNRNLSVADFNMNLGSNPNISDYSLPKNIEQMIAISERLSEDFLFVRVDLYNINGVIKFGELTFSSAAGYDVPCPESYDKLLGELITIDQSKRDNNYKYRKK